MTHIQDRTEGKINHVLHEQDSSVANFVFKLSTLITTNLRGKKTTFMLRRIRHTMKRYEGRR